MQTGDSVADLSIIEGQVNPETGEKQELLDEITGLPADVIDAILTVSKHFEKEDRLVRQTLMAFWRKSELFFEGIQRVAYDFGLSDWRRLDAVDEYDPNLYDKIINIYRAHGESLISALSIKPPSVFFYPDDAEVIEDIDAARAKTDISLLVQKHNKGTMLIMKALFVLFNQGVACAYIYNRSSKEYGTVRVPVYADNPVDVRTHSYSCPMCGGALGEEVAKDQEEDPLAPAEMQCTQCGAAVDPNVSITQEQLPQVTHYEDSPKSRTCIDVFGPLYVQMPLYARKQETMPYLRLRYEQHQALLASIFPKMREAGKFAVPAAQRDTDDRWARAYGPTQDPFLGSLSTVTDQWLRPWAFEILGEDQKELIAKCQALFPSGCFATIVGETVAQARDENLDKHWHISEHPLSNYIHADPLGKPLMPVQELRTEAVDLAIETFEHAIPETFADKEVLNFEKYGQQRAAPGMVYPVTPAMGRSIADSFHSTKTATLNEEIESFLKRVDTDGQFAVGDFPSIYGGPSMSGSKTASEYAQSRSQALQRLNISWTMLKFWWAGVMKKSVDLYVEDMITDENMVQASSRSATGFVNNWVRVSDLQGNVGRVEPDADEELPTSFAQVKQVLMELITLNSPEINSALFNPQNTPLITKAMGLPEFYIPGKNSRDKQFAEIAELLKSGPMMDGMPTVEVSIETDDHMVEKDTLLEFLNSPTGLAQRRMNPNGYANCVAHYLLHKEADQIQKQAEAQAQMMESMAGAPPIPPSLPPEAEGV